MAGVSTYDQRIVPEFSAIFWAPAGAQTVMA
jgi:hypothetical protein